MPMIPYETPIQKSDRWYIGEDKRFRFTVWATLPTTIAAGVPVNIAGWSFQWFVRSSPNEAAGVAPLITVGPGSGITIIDAPNGIVEVVAPSADTAALAPGEYHHTMIRADAGSVGVVASGPAWLGQSDYHP